LPASVRAVAPCRARGRKHHLVAAVSAGNGLAIAVTVSARVRALEWAAEDVRRASMLGRAEDLMLPQRTEWSVAVGTASLAHGALR
jgi:hypothetical protein